MSSVHTGTFRLDCVLFTLVHLDWSCSVYTTSWSPDYSVYTGTLRPDFALSALACLNLIMFCLHWDVDLTVFCCVYAVSRRPDFCIYTGTFRSDRVFVYTVSWRPDCVLSTLAHLDRIVFCLHWCI